MTFRSLLAAGAVLAATAVLPSVAEAAPAYATANVNLRAGPSTGYPVAATIGAGSGVEVFGCLADSSWCDVGVGNMRGWMAGQYLQYSYGGRRVLVPAYRQQFSAPVVSFSFGNYWDDHYRSRPFYRERDRYSRGWDGGWDRDGRGRGDWDRDGRGGGDWNRDGRGRGDGRRVEDNDNRRRGENERPRRADRNNDEGERVNRRGSNEGRPVYRDPEYRHCARFRGDLVCQ